jgi:hypothetical protein
MASIFKIKDVSRHRGIKARVRCKDSPGYNTIRNMDARHSAVSFARAVFLLILQCFFALTCVRTSLPAQNSGRTKDAAVLWKRRTAARSLVGRRQ